MKANKKTLVLSALGLAVLVGGGATWMDAHAAAGKAQTEPKSRIKPEQAIAIALGKVPGRPLNANFEFDEGKWVYGVMIVSGKTIKEVELDPISGKVGDVETVTPEGEAREVKDELTKAIGGKMTAPAKESDEKDEKAEKD